MKRRIAAAATAAVIVIVLAAGCRQQPPRTAPAAAPVHTTVVEPPGRQDMTAHDTAADPLAGDLQAVNDYLRQHGLIGDVYFDFDEYELRSDARQQLAKNAEFLRRHPELVFTIEGHCDDRGTFEYNLALGDRRAAAARAYLATLGVAAEHLRIVSFGEERPFCQGGGDESCWSQNRRGHFVVTGRASS